MNGLLARPSPTRARQSAGAGSRDRGVRGAERSCDGDPSNQLTSQARIRRGSNRRSPASGRRRVLGDRLVSVVGPSVAALARRLPRVVGITELALREIVETFLLAPQEVEFVLAFIGRDRRRIRRGALRGRGLRRHRTTDEACPSDDATPPAPKSTGWRRISPTARLSQTTDPGGPHATLVRTSPSKLHVP